MDAPSNVGTVLAPSADPVDRTYGRIFWRIIPFLMVCYVLAFIDRSNVGFAKLQFMGDLSFTETIYGIGGGIFYLGYILFEIPSNLYLQKVGVRKTLLRIMVLWGLCCVGLAFMASSNHYYVLRFLLGAAEAGLFPGILLYITYWVPASRRARFTACFMASIPLAGMIGGPLSGWLMQSMNGLMGLKGWQWLFIVEGLPASLLGIIAYYYLSDEPRDAKWLTPGERAMVQRELGADEASKPKLQHASFANVLKDPRIYWVSGMAFAVLVSTGGIFFWLPTIIKRSGVQSPLTIGLLSSIPFVIGVVVQLLVARHSDQTLERRWHAVVPALTAALAWALLPPFAQNTAASVVLLTMVTAGTLGITGPFWTIPSSYLSGAAAAGGIAVITTIAGLGSIVSPMLVGWLATQTNSFAAGQYYFSALLILGSITLLVGVKPPSRLTARSTAT
jgi:D-galactonate transporter